MKMPRWAPGFDKSPEDRSIRRTAGICSLYVIFIEDLVQLNRYSEQLETLPQAVSPLVCQYPTRQGFRPHVSHIPSIHE